jgi:putative glutamine amidotransferase
MSKPLIGLTTTYTLKRSSPPIYGTNRPYAEAIRHAGGLPILIPNDLDEADLDALLSRLEGVLFTGGYDVDPACYRHPPHPKAEKIDHERDQVEIRLAQSTARSGKPFFGICRGIQVINVALGGSLYEHLPDQLAGNLHTENHDKPRDYLAHSVIITPSTQLAKIMLQSEMEVNSLHHQGVRELAKGLQVAAIAPDGLVEAFELTGHPFGLAVQWHPEELQASFPMRQLFSAFIQACQVKEPV